MNRYLLEIFLIFSGFAMMETSLLIMKPEPPKFVADHPFAYHIWDRKQKMPIFSGHITRLE